MTDGNGRSDRVRAPGRGGTRGEAEGHGGRLSRFSRDNALLAASGLCAFGAELAAWVTAQEASVLVLLVAVASTVLGGLPTLRKGLLALRTFTLNINLLMTVAVLGAFSIGEYPEAAMVVFLFALAERIEGYALDRARNAVRSLMEIVPEEASVQQPDGSWRDVPVAEVTAGSIVRARPGERIPLDGVVVSGTSAVNQAPITGESLPVDKAIGDEVFAGTINENGLLELRTTGGTDQTTLARIIRSVQEAQASRAPTQRFVDAFARIYTPVVVTLAIVIAVGPWALAGAPFLPWLYKALVLLVIACPCALVISTPVTVVSGLAAAARRGVLIKGGAFLESGRRLKVIALDKTGTITEGKPRLTDVVPFGGRSRDEILRLAASLDAGSDHPVARALAAGWAGELLRVEGHEVIGGRGVQGRIDGESFILGNHRLVEERKLCAPEVEATLVAFEAEGKTVIVVADSREALGVLAVADTPRPTSVEALRELHGLGLRTLMLTGDNQRTAAAVAKAVGIDEARGNLLPEEKLGAIDELATTYGAVGMVGDGVNDAPALARATIGFAMGAAGSDAAIETADVALMRDDLRALPVFIHLSRKTSAILTQNIVFAIGTKLVFFGLALGGAATLWMAVLADMGASLVVVSNGLRLLRTSIHAPEETRAKRSAPLDSSS